MTTAFAVDITIANRGDSMTGSPVIALGAALLIIISLISLMLSAYDAAYILTPCYILAADWAKRRDTGRYITFARIEIRNR